MQPIVINSRVTVPASAMALHTARSSGPGGQNVNKVSSKVELRVALGGIIGLSPEQRRRLAARAESRLGEDGCWIATSQRTRSQVQNLEDARAKVRALVESALVAPRPRVPTKPTRASKVRRLDSKRHLAEKKQGRRQKDD
jgi:ribosome-associated protein